jgi:hypothetical protein
MVVIFLLSAIWTFMLAVIQQIPTQVANYLMDTGDLDNGEFWLLPMAELELDISAIIVLVLFGIGYLSLVVLMVFPDKLMPSRWNRRHDQVTASEPVRNTEPSGPKIRPIAKHEGSDAAGVEVVTKRASQTSTDIPTGLSWARVKYEMTSPHGILRQYYVSIVLAGQSRDWPQWTDPFCHPFSEPTLGPAQAHLSDDHATHLPPQRVPRGCHLHLLMRAVYQLDDLVLPLQERATGSALHCLPDLLQVRCISI